MLREYKKGDYIYDSGDSATQLFKITKGVVILGNVAETGKSFFKQFVCEGEAFGEEVLLQATQRKGYAMAFTDITVEVVPFYELSKDQQMVSDLLANVLARGQRAYDTLERTTLSAEQKLMSVLNRIGELMGRRLLNGEVLIQRHIKHKEFAFLCSCSRQCVTDLLIGFQKKGLLKIDRQSILLTEKILQ